MQRLFSLLALGLILGGPAVLAQPVLKDSDKLELSGLVYMDYNHVVDAPGDAAGDNGFGYRRLYLTSKYSFAETMSVQARLEASDGSTNEDGKPAPFVKDLYLKWGDALGDGHDLTIGISSPPSFSVAEKFFGYRSLEKTIQDRNKIVSSRDFGIAITGDLVSDASLRYGFMVGNNNSVKRETDRGKRLYGQLEWYPSERVSVTIGGDYAALDNGSAVNANGFLGYRTGSIRIGAEGYFSPLRPEDAALEMDLYGISAFAAAVLPSGNEVLVRADHYGSRADGGDTSGRYLLLGLSWVVNDNLRIIPNLTLDERPGAEEATLAGRITLHADF